MSDRAYKVICISLYAEDIEDADVMVAELKRRGHRTMGRSDLIRRALRLATVDAVERSLGEPKRRVRTAPAPTPDVVMPIRRRRVVE